jgi:putative selenium metabolism hydrolase
MQIPYATEVLSFARELVRRPSPSGQERDVAALVAQEMTMLGYDEVATDELGSVSGVLVGSAPGPTVLFDAHMDVAAITEPGTWRHDPFSGARVAGRLWGRGSADVKGNLAAALVALGALRREAFTGRLVMAASVGEETIEGLALGHILRRMGAGAVVVCEPTDLRLGLGHKGRTSVVVEARGRAAHTSRPELGVNAIDRVIEAIGRLRAVAPRRDALLGDGVSTLVEIVSEPYPGVSMVPVGCAARFERRLVRGETPDTVLDEMRARLSGLGDVSVRLYRVSLDCYTGRTFTVDDFHPAWVLEERHPVARAALRGLREAGLPAETFLAPYSTNGVASAGAMGIPTVIYGAGDIAAAHAVDESVRIDALQAAYRGYQALARALTGGMGRG